MVAIGACDIARAGRGTEGGVDGCDTLGDWSFFMRCTMKGREESVRTMRFTVPTRRPSRISRASSLWPTSSKASVLSWPPTSRRTSSPPLGIG